MHGFRCTRAFAPEKDRIVGGKGKTVERNRSRCRHQDKARSGMMIGQEGFPGSMSANWKIRQVIESNALDAPVVEKKTAWLDQVDLYPEACGKPQ